MTMTNDTDQKATLSWAQREARTLMARYLPGWRFEWDNARSRFGQCRQHDRVISMSRLLITSRTQDSVRDTILHEIAHGLAGPEVGHGLEWQDIARGIGAEPNTLRKEAGVAGRYQGTCDDCGQVVHRHRWTRAMALRALAHPECRQAYRSNMGVITWRDTGRVHYQAPR